MPILLAGATAVHSFPRPLTWTITLAILTRRTRTRWHTTLASSAGLPAPPLLGWYRKAWPSTGSAWVTRPKRAASSLTSSGHLSSRPTPPTSPPTSRILPCGLTPGSLAANAGTTGSSPPGEHLPPHGKTSRLAPSRDRSSVRRIWLSTARPAAAHGVVRRDSPSEAADPIRRAPPA